ncbi:U4/U6-U5 snRNP complex subunit LSM3 [Ascoidea rubescens DSM 1968]|uniref:LSM complex subunit LSM3 n=1 Tax=Ascoidea rubescens DSM 1968 TaxID=1344418 RepID=A0A1D2VJU6_9ASCO|nr:Sm-like ribonucleo protein [Ascoidea rubescens DSM 1968]ODV61891.1 Sm-like ribonucleo protein [Ascoidea rubescens DSM 1968]
MSELDVVEPLDLIKLSLDETVYIKLRGAREIVGTLHGYDSHCNMVLGDTVETIFLVDQNDPKKFVKKIKKHDMLFVRGDSVILVTSPDFDEV